MNRRALFTSIAMAPIAASLAACSKSSAKGKPAPSRAHEPVDHRFAPRLSGREVMRRRYFPNVTLVTSGGERVQFYDDLLKDKVVVLNFMYADCRGVCPAIAQNLVKVRRILDREFRKEVFIYSLTVQPEVDTPEKLRGFAKMHRIHDPRWHFLTGKPEEVDMLRHLLGFSDPNAELDRDKTRHSGMLRYGNEPLALWGHCQGSGEPEWIAQEIGFAIPREFKVHPRVNE